MTPALRLAAGLALTTAILAPTWAAAITPDFVGGGGSTPAVENPTEPEPEPEPDPSEKEREKKSTDGPAEDKETKSKNPVKKTKVVKPRGKPETKVYPVKTRSNYCPAGLQPVTISGEISCGSPTRSVTYQQMMNHPGPARKTRKVRATYHRSARPTCGVGVKGCSDR